MPTPGFGTTIYNANINQQNPGELSNTPQVGISIPPSYQTGIVEDVIANEEHPKYGETGGNVGLAFVRIIPDDLFKDVNQLTQAMPVNPFVQVYPLIGEMVVIKKVAERSFYDVPINITNKIGEQTYPNVSAFYGERLTGGEKAESAQRAAAGIEPYNNFAVSNRPSSERTYGTELKKLNPFAKKVRSGEGDVIFNGRFGNVIRMGSSLLRHPTAETPEPNILLTAGQWETPAAVSTKELSPYSLTFENINDDKSSIWMVANQEVDFQAATIHDENSIVPPDKRAHLRNSDESKDVPTPQYTGAQIFVTSDRVILNSKRNQIALFSRAEINLSARKSITIDTEKTAYITANEGIKLKSPDGEIFIQGKTVSIISGENLSYGTSGDYTIVGKNIFIGKRDNTQPMVLGASLALWLSDLLDSFIFTLPTAITTLRPDLFVRQITDLREKLGSAPQNPLAFPKIPDIVRLRTAASADFNSKSNFVSKTNINDSITPDTIV